MLHSLVLRCMYCSVRKKWLLYWVSVFFVKSLLQRVPLAISSVALDFSPSEALDFSPSEDALEFVSQACNE